MRPHDNNSRENRQATHWLSPERFTVYPRMLAIIEVVLAIGWVLMAKNMVDIAGKPLGYDFMTFWAASKMALAGHAPQAYDIASIFKVEKNTVPAMHDIIFVWYYPPTFYLLALPLALLPYLAAYWAFIVTTFAAYFAAFTRITRDPRALWCLAGFSGLWMNLFHGQNGFLTAALAGGALLCMPRRPVLAGVLIGLLAIKPHLALLFPLVLIAIGAWRTFFAAAVTTVIFLAGSTAVFGLQTLTACLHSLSYARGFLESGFLPWVKMPTIFALLRLLGAPVSVAYGVHALGALFAVVGVWLVWRRCADWPVRGAALMTATFFVSPYVFDYDLVWLAFPIAWLGFSGLRHGWLRGEREVLTAAWLLPLLMAPVATAVHLQLGPIVLGALLWVAVRRALHLQHETTDQLRTPAVGSAGSNVGSIMRSK